MADHNHNGNGSTFSFQPFSPSWNPLTAGFGALSLPDADKDYFHLHWVKDLTAKSTRFSPAVASSIVADIKLDYEGVAEQKDEALRTLKYAGIRWLAQLATSAFLNKVVGAVDAAIADLGQANAFVVVAKYQGLIERDYVDGITYVFNLLGNFIDGHEEYDVVAAFTYNQLSPRAQAAVFAMKDYFIERIPSRWCKNVGNLPLEMIHRDPTNAQWYLRLYKRSWHRYNQQAPWKEREPLLKRAGEAIKTAVGLDPEHPTVLLCLSEYLVESRAQMLAGRLESVEWAGESLYSVARLDQIIMRGIKTSLEVCPTTRARVKAAVILAFRSNSGGEKNWASQTEFARELLTKCPGTAKVAHLLGFIALTIDKDLRRAKTGFRRAFELAPHSFAFLGDLIMVCMAHPKKKQAKIFKLMNNVLLVPSRARWSENNRLKVLRLKGSLEFMIGHHAEGIRLWSKAWDKEIFERLQLKHERYQWPHDLINLDLILEHLDAALETGMEHNERLLEMRACAEGARAGRGDEQLHLDFGCLGTSADADDSWRRNSGGGQALVHAQAHRLRRSSLADQDDNWRVRQ